MTRAATVAAVLLIAACGTLPTEHDGLGFAARRAQLEAIPAWEMRGRLAVNTGEQAFAGRFRWVQNEEISTLSISGPLGGGVLEVTGSPAEMLVTARGERRVLDDPEADLSALVGWWLPVESLSAWLLGLPDGQFPARARVGPGGALESLEQRLWRLDYQTFQLAGGLLLPRRIDMQHGSLAVRLTLDSWVPAGRRAAP